MSGWLTLPFADAVTTTSWTFARLQDFSQRWHWMLTITICLLVLAYVVYTYYRDSVELPRGVTCSLLVLRMFAFGAILFSFLELEKKTERTIVKESRVALLVDTSQSMSLKDVNSSDTAAGERRIDQVIKEFSEGSFIDTLREKHNVTVMHFDQTSKPQQLASFSRVAQEGTATDSPQVDEAKRSEALVRLRLFLAAAGVAAGVALFLAVLYFFFAGTRYTGVMAWGLFVAVLLALGALVTAAVGHLRSSDIPLLAALGFDTEASDSETGDGEDESGEPDSADENGEGDIQPNGVEQQELQPAAVDWQTVLAPQGLETRLGDSLADIVQAERGGPLAGIVVFTEGRSNTGIECEDVIPMARDADIPIYPVGLGSAKQPVNVRVADIEAPPRVFPGDKFPITAYIQHYGLEGRNIRVELSSAPAQATADEEPSYDFEDEMYVELESSDSVLPVKFEITPEEEERRIFRVSVEPLDEEADDGDNQTRTTVQIVERKNRVLLLADGPTREYRFLRNMLYRDKDVTVDVCLQTAPDGIAQEADQIIPEFPVIEEELFDKYDCIVAFDPDWYKLDDFQVELLERWVAETAGGLILVSGPVHTPNWIRREPGDTRIDTVRALSPVVFDRWTSRSRQPSSDMLRNIVFTREGETAEFLWLDDSAHLSEQAWTDFDGVYGYDHLEIKDLKPGATVYARLAALPGDTSGDRPPHFVAQFFGAGRVFFMSSGEMWRLRSVDEDYHEKFFTKLIRHVSQGRLLRDSSRGVLMVSKQRCLLGDTIIVRAHLTDRKFQPLEVFEVEASLVLPEGQRVPIKLTPVKDAPRAGLYAGQFTALVPGDYRVELMIPDSDQGEVLMREVRARIPDLEIEQPQRNDALLQEIARQTGGEYYVGLPAALGQKDASPLASIIQPNDAPTTLPDVRDKNFARLLMGWLLAAICGALAMEWLIRRLSKLA